MIRFQFHCWQGICFIHFFGFFFLFKYPVDGATVVVLHSPKGLKIRMKVNLWTVESCIYCSSNRCCIIKTQQILKEALQMNFVCLYDPNLTHLRIDRSFLLFYAHKLLSKWNSLTVCYGTNKNSKWQIYGTVEMIGNGVSLFPKINYYI